jgi:predicted DNA-binding transcriptional regulator AlpA
MRLVAQLAQLCKPTEMNTATSLLTTEQVAARVCKKPSTVNRWAKSGKLAPVLKLPGLRGDNLFALDDVLAFIEEGTK